MLSQTLLLSLLSSTAFAHFQVLWPPSRGFDEDKIINFPCGGFDTITNRSAFPLSGAPIQLNMEHTEVKGQVTLALGNNPGVNYDIVLKPTFQENGPESFCIGDVMIPTNLNITAGTNGTIQVLTNGDPNGGLYACIDVTFTDTPLTTAQYNSHCTNSSGVSASFIGGASPNGTTSGTSASGTSSGTATSTSSKAAAAQKTMAGWAVGAIGLICGLAAL